MKKKRFVTVTLAATLVSTMFIGCSSPKPENSDAKGDLSTGKREKATVVDVDKLPVKGIGAMISSEVKAKKDYKIDILLQIMTNPWMEGRQKVKSRRRYGIYSSYTGSFNSGQRRGAG